MIASLINNFLIFLISFVVIIDSAQNEKEKDLTFDIASRLKENLIKDKKIDVVFSIESKNLTQVERANISNKSKGDIFMSFHLNSTISKDASGFEVFYSKEQNLSDDRVFLSWELVQSKYYKNSKAFANIISFNLNKEFNETVDQNWNTTNRGVTEANLLLLKGIAMPSVLLELGFLTNETEYSKMKNSVWIEKAISAISKAILEYKNRYEK